MIGLINCFSYHLLGKVVLLASKERSPYAPLPKVIFAVYIHVHYSIYVIYLWILKLYHARLSVHARLCMLFLTPLKPMLSF
jgi:hypothetical protein